MHDFAERLSFSFGVAVPDLLLGVVASGIPGAREVVRADEGDDRQGTDYWVLREYGLPPVSVDVKHRGYDPIERFGTDDACIETCSVYSGPNDGVWLDYYRDKPGWTIDERKRTDLLVYTWPAEGERRRFWILYFPHLCAAAQSCWHEWAVAYGERAALNDGYLTLSVFPPRREIARAMREFVVAVS